MFEHTRQVFNPLWNQLHLFQNEMNRLFDRWGEDGGRPQTWTTYPPINVWEVNDDLEVEAELPGLRLEDLEIFVTGNNQLTLKGERKPVAPARRVSSSRCLAVNARNLRPAEGARPIRSWVSVTSGPVCQSRMYLPVSQPPGP